MSAPHAPKVVLRVDGNLVRVVFTRWVPEQYAQALHSSGFLPSIGGLLWTGIDSMLPDCVRELAGR